MTSTPPNFVPNQITDTPWPDTPWALPTWTTGPSRPRRLFFTPANLTRFQANFAACGTITPGSPGSNSFPFPDVLNLGVFWQSSNENTFAVQDALHYLATGTSSYIATAVTHALNPAIADYGPEFCCAAFGAAFVLDWLYPVLTGTQASNLIAFLENYCAQWYTEISTGSGGHPAWNPHEGFHTTPPCFLICQIAIQGETGATDRNVALRNLAQNIITSLDDGCGDGVYPYYPYQDGFNQLWPVIWEIATGQTVTCQYMINRAESETRQLKGDGSGWVPSVSGDQTTNADATAPGGGSGSAFPVSGYKTLGPAWCASMCATMSHGNNGLWKWLEGQCQAVGQTSNQRNMTNAMTGCPMWVGLIFYDNTITPTPPETIPLSLNKALYRQRAANFRSTWTTLNSSNIDVRVWFTLGNMQSHSVIGQGVVEVYRGLDTLLKKGTTYITAGGAGHSWYSDEWSDMGLSKNLVTFAPTGSSIPDSAGSQRFFEDKTAAWQVSSGARWFIWGERYFAQSGCFRCGEITYVDFPSSGSGSYGMVHADIADAYSSYSKASSAQYVQAYTRKVVCIPGASPGQMTIIIRDQFTTQNVNLIKWGFYCNSKPTVNSSFSPVQVAGTPTTGVISYN